MRLVKVKRRILAMDDAPILDEVNDVESYLFLLRANEKANDLLKEATIMHELLAESLWHYKILYRSNILDTNTDSDNDVMEQ